MPDELDPQVREFASQLRRLVDRSGLSVASVADRTGYSKTSWERYLNGRLLAPKGAIVALAEVTGTNPVHLTTMWELAERAWSRSEMRHDMTMEAIRISQARAALSEFGAPPADTKGGKAARGSGPATAVPGVAGPAGVAPSVPSAPSVPVQPTAPEADDAGDARDAGDPGGSSSQAGSSGANSWRLAGYRGPSPAGGRPPGAATPAAGAEGSAWTPTTPSPFAEPQGTPPPVGDPSSGGGRRRLTMFLAGVVGVLVVIAAVFFLTDNGGGKKNEGGGKPSPSAGTPTSLPPGVKCAGASCTGKDAEAMGCTKDTTAVTTAKTVVVGTTTLEVRYSRTCGAAWGRITQAAQGDSVQVTAGAARQNDSITTAGDTIAYTPMVAVKDAGEAKACATLASGRKGCTR
ncbi:helix-turn-helix domain-containing protein [Streptomyces sediminimaris]|uniref:helix-turn-helix domain-containing protein n=1 Tax=Streptomyces sediminimaris TaxID=3383721 RepID=UPI00399AB1D3